MTEEFEKPSPCLNRKKSSAAFCGLLSVMVYAILFSGALRAHDVSADSKPASIIVKVGVRGDAKPFSYIDITRASETILPGFGGYSIEVCRHVLKQMKSLPRYSNFEFKAVEIKARSRFKDLGVNGELFMLCGPDSITTERLLDFRSTHAVFLSGMTYAYINPRSPKFPRGNYCENIIGVVRGTTADTEGLADIASRDLLMRFDKALDLELNKASERIAMTRKVLHDLIVKEVEYTKAVIDEYDKTDTGRLSDDERERRGSRLKWRDSRLFEQQVLKNMLDTTDPGNLDKALDELVRQKNGLAGKITDLMSREHAKINGEVAREIVTEECPQGFTRLPVRKFEGHDAGIAAFCTGEVLYYLADYDILKSRTQEVADCDIVMNRFTRSREVYGVYFPKVDIFDIDPEPGPKMVSYTCSYTGSCKNMDTNSDSLINVAGFYADFNNFLLMALQGEVSDIEKIFEQEFGIQQKSEDLERFFDSFKIGLK